MQLPVLFAALAATAVLGFDRPAAACGAAGSEARAPLLRPAVEAPQEFSPPSLESLRILPREEATPMSLDLEAADGSEVPAAPARRPLPGAEVVDQVRERLHVERRSQAIGPSGARQGSRSETEAGLRVPLDESVSVEGGVQVDQRDEPGADAPERKSRPRVGVEVRF